MRKKNDTESADIIKELYVEDKRLEKYGENCAKAAFSHSQGTAGTKTVVRTLSRAIKSYGKTVVKIGGFTSSDIGNIKSYLPGEFSWISENEYMIAKEGKGAARELAGRYRLPGSGAVQGYPAVYLLAVDFLKTGAGEFSPERLKLFLKGVQNERVLREDEFNLFIPMLKCAAIAAIANLGKDVLKIVDGYRLSKSGGGVNPFYSEMEIWRSYELGVSPDQKDILYSQTAEKIHKHLSEGLKNYFRILRTAGDNDFVKALRASSMVEITLNKDPSRTYPAMDDESKAYYRHLLSLGAKRRKTTEYELSKKYLASALEGTEPPRNHVGFYILNDGAVRERKRAGGRAFLALDTVLPLAACIALGVIFRSFWLSLAVLLPLWEISRSLLLYIFLRTADHTRLPALALKNGVPPEGKTLCVITILTDSEKYTLSHIDLLEKYYLANKSAGENVLYAILADFPDSKEPETLSDDLILDSALEKTRKLNEKYGERFCFIHRKREYNAREKIFMGRERKRGAIESLCALICEGTSESIVCGVDSSRVADVSYLITLDADTKLMPGAIRRLAGVMLHPLNRAVIDAQKRCVTSGYGIIQPRISVDLRSANATQFSRIYAGQGGIDPYSSVAGDIYQNLFSESIFIGKGIIDVRAMHACLAGTVPDNTVLSHDLLEGCFLRTGYLADTELPDGFPSSVRSYFKRAGRWTRGDFQVLPWLAKNIKTRSGSMKNPLSRLSKYKIADNIRRAVTPVACFIGIALYAVFLTPVTAVFALSSLAALSAPLIQNCVERINNFGNKVNTRYHSTIYAGFRGGLLLFFSRFLFVPFEAWTALKSAAKSLWRMAVTKRKLLEWVTAAEAEKNKTKGLAGQYLVMLPSVAAGAAVIALGMNPVAALLALFWLLSPMYAEYISKKIEQKIIIPGKDRQYLLDRAREIWAFFNDFLSKNDNFLPPDNYQEEPCGTIAHRTSPTNIGLAMIAVICAKRLDFIGCERAQELIENILNTVTGLKKYSGHLYNWYDTHTLEVLTPETISSVDSGNFVSCLLICAAALESYENEKAAALAARCRELFEKTDFSVMYDPDNRLINIGLNAQKKSLGGYYDMLASEARLTSYAAIAKGDVPYAHWKRLSRLLCEKNGYSGLVSWSGSCFEYLMPNIIMPEMQNSLIYESNRYAIYCQRLRAKKAGMPWGISESCYFAFDSALNYQYKAHGVASLALKAGVNEELVISPYSTYLALLCEPKIAVENLKALEALGVTGRYGLYEAIDCTTQRLPAGESFKTVKAYMTHHLGMSLCAIGNALTASENGGYLCDLFLKEPVFASCESLLCERVPVNAVNITAMRPTPSVKKSSNTLNGYSFIIEKYNHWLPPCNISTNKKYTLVAAASGITRSSMSDLLVYRSGRSADTDLPGVITLIKASGSIFSVTDLPGDDTSAVKKTVFTSQGTKFTADYKTLSVTQTVRVAPGEAGEHREVYIQNRGESRENITLCFYFEPVLTPESDYLSHPDFTKMFLSSKKTDGGVLITKKNRAGGPDVWLCALCDAPAAFTTSRKNILRRNSPGDIAVFFENPEAEDFGQVRDVGVRVLADVEVGPKTDTIVRLALCCGTNAANTENSARRVLLLPEKHNADAFLEKAISLGLDASSIKEALELAPCVFFEPYARRCFKDRIKTVSGARGGLWKLGLSGDVPIALLSYDEFLSRDEFIKAVFRYTKLHALLSGSGAAFDLAVLNADGGDYDRPCFNACFSAIKISGSGRAVGKKGGIHLFDASQLKEEEVLCLFAAASFMLPAEIKPGESSAPSPAAQIPLPAGASSGLNPRIHSCVYANPFFGFTGADYGLTHMWCANSRLFKLTPWENDILTSQPRGEDIRILRDGASVSVFCRNDGYRASVAFLPSCATWEKQFRDMNVRTKAFVDPKRPVRIVVVEIDGIRDDTVELTWLLRPVMGENDAENRTLETRYDEELGSVTVFNPFADEFNPKHLALGTSPAPEGFTCDYVSYRQGSFDNRVGNGYLPCVAFKVTLRPTDGKARAVFAAAVGDNEETKNMLPGLSSAKGSDDILRTQVAQSESITSAVKINTPDAALNRYINVWNAWQIVGSRLYARSSVYQNGGAYGFRDQLQDAASLLMTHPDILKKQILRCCAHQYEEGDVMHWFHSGMRKAHKRHKGVRTFCSDDLIWLVWAVCEYVKSTGDTGILSIKAPYLKSDPLSENERERYENPEQSGLRESVYEHCERALSMFEKRGYGEHGLPKILGGDWNDGLNRLGENGRGESVWLAWFISETVRRFSRVCESAGQTERAAQLKGLARNLAVAAGNAWDGAWFRRGYDDSGRPVGSAANEECRIDSIAQSFALFCGAYGESREESEKQYKAILGAVKHLVDFENKIVRLFTPPIVRERQYGYISAYPPGVRENGGQYTHAAVWLAMALFRAGENETGCNILNMLLPENHDAQRYEGERFVLAADVGGHGVFTGKCGWSWYTGAAGWYRRAVIESMLGIKKEGGVLSISPNVPRSWPGFECEIIIGKSLYVIRAHNTGTRKDAQLALSDDGARHEIDVFY